MTPEQEVEKIVSNIEKRKHEKETMSEVAASVENSINELARLCKNHGCEFHVEYPREVRFQELNKRKPTVRMSPCNVTIEKTERIR